MRKIIFCLGLAFLTNLTCTALHGQDTVKTRFRYPLDGNFTFTGNYGELRPNHFHSGIDFRTHPTKNLPIHAIEDGYVSRIKVGSNGYGKVLYITHKNGYVSVYGHEHHFAEKIKAYTYALQKKAESFEIEIFPKPEELPVKKGEVIGFTGNTGNTTGPHLHFEIRDMQTEIPLNPQLLLEHEDTEAPVCYKMAIYQLYDAGEPTLHKTIDLSAFSKKKTIQLNETLSFPFAAGLAFSAFDTEKKGGGRNQVYSISIKIDGQVVYAHKMNNIPFEHARYVNWFADQNREVKKEKFQKCFKTGNNDLPIFIDLTNQGIIEQKFIGTHEAEITFADIKGNSSQLRFSFKQREGNGKENKTYNFNCLKKKEIHLKGLEANFPEKCLFYDVNFDAALVKTKTAGMYSNLYRLHNPSVQLLKAYELCFEVENVAPAIENKLCIVRLSEDLKEKNYWGGEFKNGKVCGMVKELGLFTVIADSTAPKINQVQKDNTNGLYFKVTDDLSGIGEFRLEINGKWVYAEYEHKSSLIFCEYPEGKPANGSAVKLIIWDKKKNRKELTTQVN